jgi:hypothetical protein
VNLTILVAFFSVVYAQTIEFNGVRAAVNLDRAKGFRVSVADVNNDDYPHVYVTSPNTSGRQYLYVFDPETKQYDDISESSGIRKNRSRIAGRASDGAIFADVKKGSSLCLPCFR